MTIDPEKWVEKHGDVLYRFALLRVSDPGLAEDLVQDTLCAAFESREKYSGKSSERTWLVGILKHKIADHFRKSSRGIAYIDPADLPDGDAEDLFDEKGQWRIEPGKWRGSPEEVVEKREFWDVFHKCLDGLSPNIRQAFALKELDELESEEICKVLEISATNFWVMLHRARGGLRRCLELNWFKGAG